ncbi:MAG: GNAT family N-acetyltransferase [Candidatus Bathyarchaeia archaeon]
MHVIIREMQPNEKKAVEGLFKGNLGTIDRIIFQLALNDVQRKAQKQNGGTMIAEYNGKIVGSVSMRIQVIKAKRIGFIDALVTDRELRGRGIGGSLVDNAILWLKERGCEVIYATADRYNSPSWNIFIHRGFYPYEFPQQFRDYGLNFLRLWFGEFHFIGFGTFFLRCNKDQGKSCETGGGWHLLFALLGVSVALWIQLLRSRGPLTLIPAIFAVVALSILIHELPQKIAARKLGLETTFKAWDSGILFSWLLALLGGFFPAYGSIYVKQLDWWYDPKKDKTGVMFALGPVSSLVLSLTFWMLSILATDNLLVESAKVGYTTSLLIVILNLIPMQAAGGFTWDGKKILTWNKTVWASLVIATTALIIQDVFF